MLGKIGIFRRKSFEKSFSKKFHGIFRGKNLSAEKKYEKSDPDLYRFSQQGLLSNYFLPTCTLMSWQSQGEGDPYVCLSVRQKVRIVLNFVLLQALIFEAQSKL
jgi:hypothetical protein